MTITTNTPRCEIPRDFKDDVNTYILHVFHETREVVISSLRKFLRFCGYSFTSEVPQEIIRHCLSEGILITHRGRLYNVGYMYILRSKNENKYAMYRKACIPMTVGNILFYENLVLVK